MDVAPLIGRRSELAELERLLQHAQRGVAQFLVMFGRRRVGKTHLLRHFAAAQTHSVPVAYYAATREAPAQQRSDLIDQLRTAGVDLAIDPSRPWTELFDALFDAARSRPLVVIIDEAPYLVERDRAWPTALQRVWDADQSRADQSSLLLVLNGSAISTMTQMISSQGALYERPTSVRRIEPFSLPMAHEALGWPDATVTIEAQAACGGYPLLLRRWDPERDASSNLSLLAADPFAPLVANANALLLDIADTGGHHIVLGAIGRGASKLSEISSRAGQRAEHSLQVLEQAGLVGRRTPLGEPARKNLHYELVDGYLRFWFAIVERNIQLIESGQGQAVMRRAQPLWLHHVAAVFERESRAHAARLASAGILGEFVATGEWWTDSGTQAQVDIVGLGPTGRWTLAGEAKWTDRFGRSALDQLVAGVAAARRTDDRPGLAGWSRLGPSDDVRRLAPDMLHFTAEMMVTDSPL